MDREANLPVPPRTHLLRPTSNSVTTSSSSPPPFLRNVQAAFKRHRPLGTVVQTSNIMPRRVLLPQRDVSKATSASSDMAKKFNDVEIPSSQVRAVSGSSSSVVETKNLATSVVRDTQEDEASSVLVTSVDLTFEDPSNVHRDQLKLGFNCEENNRIPVPFPRLESHYVDGKKMDHLLMANNATSREMEWDASNPVEVLHVINDEQKHQNFRNMESDICLRPDGSESLLSKRTTELQDQVQQLRTFLSQPVTRSSVVGTSCPTTTSIHSTSAPMLNSTTYCPHSQPDDGTPAAIEPLRGSNAVSQQATQKSTEQLCRPSVKNTSEMVIDQVTSISQASFSAVDDQIKEDHAPRVKQANEAKGTDVSKKLTYDCENPRKERGLEGDATDGQYKDPSSKGRLSNDKSEPSGAEKQEKVTGGKGASVPRKKGYDPELFFKVNGKLYQRLGKIGSGGSSEVHKVISSDCTIYALKKIKLKGRDYATAYGFCQEILYLNKLKGMNNIIQLIDYEVTDRNLLHEVMNGSMSNKDGRLRDDGYIYMVLEYGEIDLAHMLSHKWKEIGHTNQTIDENWLRFYWQQILQAVNTIHEERIVHSDLKPANFLLVKGSLKLIDFGIAKAIMSDTTNIQRDSQVGTLSYMSPEAFMCNECDANGNTIKCGRPSDIWSLGCILYQMVYGRTPFAEYKTFWTKFKVTTDPNHEITYEPLQNPLLLDLMKKCLAWDRHRRWRIPQLLQHPFLVPPVPTQPSMSEEQDCKLLQIVADACAHNEEASKLLCELRQLLKDPVATLSSQSLTSPSQQCQVLSKLCALGFQLRECLSKLERE